MIKKLTKKQEKKIPIYLKKWMDNGLSTKPISFKTAVSECKWIYSTFLKEHSPEPMVFLAQSPMQGLVIANAIKNMKINARELESQLGSQLGGQLDGQLGSQLYRQLDGQLGSQLYRQLESQLGSQLYSQLGSQLYRQLGSQLGSQLESQLGSQLGGQLYSQLYRQLGSQLGSQIESQLGSQTESQLGSQLGGQLYSQLYRQLHSQLGSQIESQLGSQTESQLGGQLYSQLYRQLHSQLNSQLDGQLGSQLESQLGSQLGGQLYSQLNSQLDGQLGSQLGSQLESPRIDWTSYRAQAWYWGGYYGFYDYVLNELLPEKRKELSLMVRWAKSLERINWIIPLSGACIVVQRPTEIHLGEPDQNGIRRLHKDGGMAVRYEDGWGLYSLNGIRVPQAIAETPKEKINKDMIVKETNADVRREIVRKVGQERLVELLDSKVIDSFNGYELITFDIGDGRVRPFLKMVNPSIGVTHVEGVRPGITTVKEALCYRNGLSEYEAPQQLT